MKFLLIEIKLLFYKKLILLLLKKKRKHNWTQANRIMKSEKMKFQTKTILKGTLYSNIKSTIKNNFPHINQIQEQNYIIKFD